MSSKTPRIRCGLCGQGVFRKSPGKDAYVCSAPKQLDPGKRGGVCNRHISGKEFRELLPVRKANQ